MNGNVRYTNFFWRYVSASAWHHPLHPLENIIMVCHEKGRHPPPSLPPNRYVLFETPLTCIGKCDRYYIKCDRYYKVWQLSSVTEIYYRVWLVLQSVIFITKWDITPSNNDPYPHKQKLSIFLHKTFQNATIFSESC